VRKRGGDAALTVDEVVHMGKRMAWRLAPTLLQATPTCGGGRVSGGRRCEERGGAALLTGVEARRIRTALVGTASPSYSVGKQLGGAAQAIQ
jgi:hypothetical protein